MRGTEKRKSRRTMSHCIPETNRCVVVVHRRAVIVIVIVAVIVTETVIVADYAPADVLPTWVEGPEICVRGPGGCMVTGGYVPV